MGLRDRAKKLAGDDYADTHFEDFEDARETFEEAVEERDLATAESAYEVMKEREGGTYGLEDRLDDQELETYEKMEQVHENLQELQERDVIEDPTGYSDAIRGSSDVQDAAVELLDNYDEAVGSQRRTMQETAKTMLEVYDSGDRATYIRNVMEDTLADSPAAIEIGTEILRGMDELDEEEYRQAQRFVRDDDVEAFTEKGIEAVKDRMESSWRAGLALASVFDLDESRELQRYAEDKIDEEAERSLSSSLGTPEKAVALAERFDKEEYLQDRLAATIQEEIEDDGSRIGTTVKEPVDGETLREYRDSGIDPLAGLDNDTLAELADGGDEDVTYDLDHGVERAVTDEIQERLAQGEADSSDIRRFRDTVRIRSTEELEDQVREYVDSGDLEAARELAATIDADIQAYAGRAIEPALEDGDFQAAKQAAATLGADITPYAAEPLADYLAEGEFERADEIADRLEVSIAQVADRVYSNDDIDEEVRERLQDRYGIDFRASTDERPTVYLVGETHIANEEAGREVESLIETLQPEYVMLEALNEMDNTAAQEVMTQLAEHESPERIDELYRTRFDQESPVMQAMDMIEDWDAYQTSWIDQDQATIEDLQDAVRDQLQEDVEAFIQYAPGLDELPDREEVGEEEYVEQLTSHLLGENDGDLVDARIAQLQDTFEQLEAFQEMHEDDIVSYTLNAVADTVYRLQSGGDRVEVLGIDDEEAKDLHRASFSLGPERKQASAEKRVDMMRVDREVRRRFQNVLEERREQRQREEDMDVSEAFDWYREQKEVMEDALEDREFDRLAEMFPDQQETIETVREEYEELEQLQEKEEQVKEAEEMAREQREATMSERIAANVEEGEEAVALVGREHVDGIRDQLESEGYRVVAQEFEPDEEIDPDRLRAYAERHGVEMDED